MTWESGTGLHTVRQRADRAPVATRPTMAAAAVAAVDATASWGATPSPDGSAVAFVSDRSGAPRAWIRRDDGSDATLLPTGFDPVQRIRWSPDGAWLACQVAPEGAARTEVWIIRPDGGDLRQVAGFGDRTATFGHWSHYSGRLVVAEDGGIGLDSRAFLLDPATGHTETLRSAPLLAGLDISPGDRWVLLRRGPRSARWLEAVDTTTGVVRTIRGDADSGTTDLGYFAGPSTVLARSDVGRDLAALVAVDLETAVARPEVLVSRRDAELEDIAVSADGTTVALLWNVFGGRSDVTLFAPATGRQHALAPIPGAVLADCRLSADGTTLWCTAQDPNRPRSVWRIDTASGDARPVTYSPTHVTPDVEMKPELHSFPARDGLELSGWLYRTPGKTPAPILIYFHGGPEGQTRPHFAPLFRSLVANGISVFAPNVRGSSGFGRTYVNADNRERRHVAIEDAAAAVDHVCAIGVADPERVACMGRSYGGYLTLAALVRFADLFAAGVDVCGMVDLETFYAHTEPWIAAAAVSKYGDPATDRALLRALSPIHTIDHLRAPLLVVHGAHDTNVPVGEAEQVVAALEANRVLYDYLLFSDEGHEILGRENRRYMIDAVTDWLTTHLS